MNAAILFVAAWAISLVNLMCHGAWNVPAFIVVSVALVVTSWRFLSSDHPVADRWLAAGALVILALCPLRLEPTTYALEPGSIAVLALLATYLIPVRNVWLERARFAAFAIAFLVAGIGLVRAKPSPPIDVWTIQMRGAEVMLEGKNPYVWATVPDTDPESDFTVPFVYPPMVLYGAVIGFLFRDARYTLLAAMLVTGLALRAITARQKMLPILADAPALLFWHVPVILFILELAWVDALPLAFLAAGVAAVVWQRGLLAATLIGLAISTKQSLFWVYPLAGFILGFTRRQWIVMAVAAVLPALPFLLWNPLAMKHAIVDLIATLPPRHDALCVTNAVWQAFGAKFPHAVAFPLAAAVVAFACRYRRGLAAFPLATLVTYYVFFYFNRWAFANYYFFLCGLALVAVAAALALPRESRSR